MRKLAFLIFSAALVATAAAAGTIVSTARPSKNDVTATFQAIGIVPGAIVPIGGKNWKLRYVTVGESNGDGFRVDFALDPQ